MDDNNLYNKLLSGEMTQKEFEEYIDNLKDYYYNLGYEFRRIGE